MPVYQAPLRDQQFVLHEVLHAVESLQRMPPFTDLDAETVNQVLEQGGRFCTDVLLPLNLKGDAQGCRFDPVSHEVRTPEGFRAAFDQMRQGGWQGLTAGTEYGGQALPHVLQSAFGEMCTAANQSWSMYSGLTLGAYECLHANGTAQQKTTFLPKLASAEWTGTMCLTEAHCGTDLGLLRTRAEPQPDGSYRITGQKIFISAGEHDLADNIVHLVLARLPDAPAGTKGISLFVVPKLLPAGQGASAGIGARNALYCGGIEHKMGIHANSTCQVVFEGATGWLVGEPNRGLNAMFVMMNSARLAVGMQGLGLTEVAYQNAAAYAKERVQGRSLAPGAAHNGPADPIIVHPDVRRSLLTARAWADGGRAFAYWLALMVDQEHHHPDESERRFAADMLALMTPVAKAFLTDNAFDGVSQCLQVFGGHGYIHESGMEQMLRDARINMIYEGTNAIQALDLLGRKVLMDAGAKLRAFGKLVQDFISEHGNSADMNEFVTPLADLGDKVQKLTMEIGMKAMSNPEEAGAAAVSYLRVIGHLVFAYFWAKMARVALDRTGAPNADPFYRVKLATARFYFQRLLPETAYHIRAARSGAKNLMELEAELF
ncbi:MAG TPA: acyl-CoA dehydrogenase C-terminal domain-containing protein [Burkholderiaceae bacterium]|jgi:alkylation response protein AidB-like acyl-CoA dehydrogenase|nr:acyl-CoA dehydrogenase C-terminal domain-containing protein [Burkholderiaceae bacterium]